MNSESGKVTWKFRAVPSERKVLSGGRMISLWPVRGGPVVHDERIYFAAGVWPFEGVFIYCFDAATGKVVWRNDEASFVYGQHPHDALFVKGESAWPWVAASGVEGAETITVAGLKPGTYVVKLYFVEPQHDKVGKRLFDISLNGKAVAEKFDVVEAVGGRMRSLMRQYRDIESKGELRIVLSPQAGRTILSGVEIVKKGLTVY